LQALVRVPLCYRIREGFPSLFAMAADMIAAMPESVLECQGAAVFSPSCDAAEVPIATRPPPGLGDCRARFSMPTGSAPMLPAPPGLDNALIGLEDVIRDVTQDKALVPEACSVAQGDCWQASMTEAQAWWWHYSSMGGGQAPWMALAQYDPAEPISIVSSDSSPTGCGQWWQRSDVGWKKEVRERFWSGSTMAGSVVGSDGPSTDENDDEGTVLFSDDDDEAIVQDQEDGDDDWNVSNNFGQTCDLRVDDFNSSSCGQGDDVEEFSASCDEPRNSLASEQFATTENLLNDQKPAVAWKKAPAHKEATEVKAPTAHFSVSDFPLLGAAQPRRRGGRS